MRDDAVDEDNIVLCCALGCVNCGTYRDADCMGCSGKLGLCCLNLQFCCKPSAPCLPCGCCGPRCENDGCSVFNAQCQLCGLVVSGAFPCNKEVPVALTALGFTLFPKCGCCVKIGDLKKTDEDYVTVSSFGVGQFKCYPRFCVGCLSGRIALCVSLVFWVTIGFVDVLISPL
jgi:hypothetical protein